MGQQVNSAEAGKLAGQGRQFFLKLGNAEERRAFTREGHLCRVKYFFNIDLIFFYSVFSKNTLLPPF